MRWVLNDTVSIYFSEATLANPFVARWRVGGRIEITGSVFQVREDEPAPRVGAGLSDAVSGYGDQLRRPERGWMDAEISTSRGRFGLVGQESGADAPPEQRPALCGHGRRDALLAGDLLRQSPSCRLVPRSNFSPHSGLTISSA
jgi:hypothetical protein